MLAADLAEAQADKEALLEYVAALEASAQSPSATPHRRARREVEAARAGRHAAAAGLDVIDHELDAMSLEMGTARRLEHINDAKSAQMVAETPTVRQVQEANEAAEAAVAGVGGARADRFRHSEQPHTEAAMVGGSALHPTHRVGYYDAPHAEAETNPPAGQGTLMSPGDTPHLQPRALAPAMAMARGAERPTHAPQHVDELARLRAELAVERAAREEAEERARRREMTSHVPAFAAMQGTLRALLQRRMGVNSDNRFADHLCVCVCDVHTRDSPLCTDR